MKSQKAKEFIDGCMAHLTVEMSDHAKWQLRAAMTHAAELAEQEMEGFYTCWIDPKDFMPEANKNVQSHRLARNDVAIWECEGHGEEPRPNRNTPRRASSRRCIGIIQF